MFMNYSTTTVGLFLVATAVIIWYLYTYGMTWGGSSSSAPAVASSCDKKRMSNAGGCPSGECPMSKKPKYASNSAPVPKEVSDIDAAQKPTRSPDEWVKTQREIFRATNRIPPAERATVSRLDYNGRSAPSGPVPVFAPIDPMALAPSHKAHPMFNRHNVVPKK